MKSPLPLVPIHITEKGVARVRVADVLRTSVVRAQLAAVRVLRRENGG